VAGQRRRAGAAAPKTAAHPPRSRPSGGPQWPASGGALAARAKTMQRYDRTLAMLL